MNLEPKVCYRALKSRDPRFDGRFFIGVRTTGIYCRPICPARTPKRENIQFYPCAAAAEEAGLRPCLRCRPESSPGTPAWAGTSATVSRALRLIREGVMDDSGVDELSARLGVGSRHLRRLFDEHLGASPVAIAQNRRVLFAKQLISDTALPLTEIAFVSGYSSIRRFNTAFKNAYRMAPRDLRRTHKNRKGTKADSTLQLKLSYRPPFDWDWLTGFLATRAIPGVESVENGIYRRTVTIGETVGIIEVTHDPGKRQLILYVPAGLSKGLQPLVEGVRRIFDLKADPQAVENHFKNDPTLGKLARQRPGLRVPGAWDGFEAAVRAILGQQVSVKGATTLCTRVVQRYGEPLPGATEDSLRYLFPTPQRLARARMNNLGITGARIQTIRRLAQALVKGDVSLSTSASLEEAVDGLVALPGIGPWTAHYIAMRALGEPDAFPTGDLGLRKACERIDGETISDKKLLQMAEAWRPWRAYATMHLWASLAD